MANRKEFICKDQNDVEIKLAVKSPNQEDMEEADKAYSAKIATLVRETGKKKLLLRSEVDKYLKESGVWGEEDTKAIAKLDGEIDDLLLQLRAGGIKLSQGRKICIDILDKRKELMRINSKRQIFDNTTIESSAETEKIDYYIYACTVDSVTGIRHWNSFEDMKLDKLTDAYSQANGVVYEVVFGVDSGFEKRLPENSWLKKYNFIDSDLNYTNRKTGEKVDRDGRPIAALENEMKKKYDNLQGEITEEKPFEDDTE